MHVHDDDDDDDDVSRVRVAKDRDEIAAMHSSVASDIGDVSCAHEVHERTRDAARRSQIAWIGSASSVLVAAVRNV